MPIAVLITEPLRRLTRGVALVRPLWEAQLHFGELMLARARSLYLVNWWRPDNMVVRDGLLANVRNFHELRQRLAGDRSEEESLLDPASGRSGAAIGRIVSPLGAIGVGLLTGRLIQDGHRWALHSVWAITLALIVGTAVLGLLPIVAPRTAFVSTDPGYVAQLDALGRLAKALDVSGSQNPVVKLALEFLDELAALFATLLGAFAVFLVHIAPLLSQLARQIDALAPLAWTLAQTLVWTYTDTVFHLDAFLMGKSGPLSVLRRIVQALGRTFGRIGAHFEGMWQFLLELVLAHRTVAAGAVDAWFGRLNTYLELATPFATLQWTLGRLEFVKSIWMWAIPEKKEKGFGAKYWARLEPEFEKAIAPLTASKPLPAITISFPPVPELDPLPMKLDRWFTPRFADGRGNFKPGAVMAVRLVNLRESTPPEPLPIGIEEVEAFRALAERVVAPGALEYIPRLGDVLQKISHQPLEFPVRALPGSRLRPRVQQLRVRVSGGDRAAGEAWAATLRAALQRESYVVPAGA